MGHSRHNLAIDLTEHFQCAVTGKRVPQRKWERFPSRLERNAETTLRLLERHGARATFFVDGWIATRHPAVVAAIARAGHEIAARGGASDRLGETVVNLEAAGGHVVQGWRPASARIGRPPADHPAVAFVYGIDDSGGAQPRHHDVDTWIVPERGHFSTGQELRLLPDILVPFFLRSWTRARCSSIFSFAAWELDPDVQRLAIHSGMARLRAYRNLQVFEARLGRLLTCAEFTSFRDSLGLPDRASARPLPRRQRSVVDDRPLPLRLPVTIVVPCFNEEPGLAYLSNVLDGLQCGIGRLHGLSFVFVDDGSTDGTWSEMQRLFGSRKNCKLIRHEQNRGIGAAIATGIAAAEDEIVAVIDSDCSYDPARIGEMLELLKPDIAAVTASPYHAQGGVEGVPQWRLFLSKGASALYRLVLRNKLATYTSCFRVYRKPLVEQISLRHDGFIGVVEMLARLDMQGRRIVEYPVVLETRLLGYSKLRTAPVIAGHLRFLSEIAVGRLAEWRRSTRIKATM